MSLLGVIAWLTPFLKVLLAVIAAHLIVKYTSRTLERLLHKKGWRGGFLRRLTPLLELFIWLLGLYFLALFYRESIDAADVGWLVFRTLDLGVVVLASSVVFLLAFEGKRLLCRKTQYNRTVIELLFKFVLLFIGFISLVGVLIVFGIPVGGLLAFGGLSGLVVTVAMENLLRDIFSGIFTAIDKPLRVGDRILSVKKDELDGIVQNVGWRLTRILQLDGRPIYFPNSKFANSAFINDSRIKNRGIYRKISIRYEDIEQMHQIIREIQGYIRNLETIDHTLLNTISFTEFGDKGLDLKLRLYLKTKKSDERNEEQEAILFSVCNIIAKHKGKIARHPKLKLIRKMRAV